MAIQFARHPQAVTDVEVIHKSSADDCRVHPVASDNSRFACDWTLDRNGPDPVSLFVEALDDPDDDDPDFDPYEVE